MKSVLDQIVRQFLRFHFGRWTPRDTSNPIEAWERAKVEAWDREEKEVLGGMRDRRAEEEGRRS